MGAFAEPIGLFAAGDPDGARARREEVMALWRGQQFNVQRVIAMISEIHSSLYAGAGAVALEGARRERAEAHRHGFDRLAVGSISTDY